MLRKVNATASQQTNDFLHFADVVTGAAGSGFDQHIGQAVDFAADFGHDRVDFALLFFEQL